MKTSFGAKKINEEVKPAWKGIRLAMGAYHLVR